MVTEHSYTLANGTKIRDVIDWDTGMCDRYVQPIKAIEFIHIDIVITKGELTC